MTACQARLSVAVANSPGFGGAPPQVWKDQSFDLFKYMKGTEDRGYVLKSVEEVTLLLEDMGLNLQSMMASRFVKPFLDDVQRWEKKLSLIAETIEVRGAADRQDGELADANARSRRCARFLGAEASCAVPCIPIHLDRAAHCSVRGSGRDFVGSAGRRCGRASDVIALRSIWEIKHPPQPVVVTSEPRVRTR